MKKENDELTNLFLTRLQDVEMPVRDGFWEELQDEIPVMISRRRLFIRRFSAAASVMLILAGTSAAFWYFSPKEEIATAFTQMTVSTGTSAKMGIDVVHEELPSFQASTTSPVPASSKPGAMVDETEEEESFSMSISMSFSFSSSSSNETQHQNNTNRYENQASYAGGLNEGSASSQTKEESVSPVSIEKEKKRTWSVGVYASAGLLNDRIHSDQIQPFYTTPTIDGTPMPGTIKHKQPFSAGVAVRKELSDRWGIESGLVYTQLNSEISAASGTLSYTQDQKLHYIGIPVKADVSLYKTERINLYASAGGMVEKCVGGDVKPNPLQLSLTAAAGIQYKLNDRLSLYAEPGLSYHFDDGSPVSTIRKEKPLNVNLSCGVRMTY